MSPSSGSDQRPNGLFPFVSCLSSPRAASRSRLPPPPPRRSDDLHVVFWHVSAETHSGWWFGWVWVITVPVLSSPVDAAQPPAGELFLLRWILEGTILTSLRELDSSHRYLVLTAAAVAVTPLYSKLLDQQSTFDILRMRLFGCTLHVNILPRHAPHLTEYR